MMKIKKRVIPKEIEEKFGLRALLKNYFKISLGCRSLSVRLGEPLVWIIDLEFQYALYEVCHHQIYILYYKEILYEIRIQDSKNQIYFISIKPCLTQDKWDNRLSNRIQNVFMGLYSLVKGGVELNYKKKLYNKQEERRKYIFTDILTDDEYIVTIDKNLQIYSPHKGSLSGSDFIFYTPFLNAIMLKEYIIGMNNGSLPIDFMISGEKVGTIIDESDIREPTIRDIKKIDFKIKVSNEVLSIKIDIVASASCIIGYEPTSDTPLYRIDTLIIPIKDIANFLET